MVGMTWLLLAYLLHTTGELCLSPVGLSMVNKLSPKRMVATMLGAWYLATAFSQFLAGIIAQLTGVHEAAAGGADHPRAAGDAGRVRRGVWQDRPGELRGRGAAGGADALPQAWMHQDEEANLT
jgi:MFS family permease